MILFARRMSWVLHKGQAPISQGNHYRVFFCCKTSFSYFSQSIPLLPSWPSTRDWPSRPSTRPTWITRKTWRPGWRRPRRPQRDSTSASWRPKVKTTMKWKKKLKSISFAEFDREKVFGHLSSVWPDLLLIRGVSQAKVPQSVFAYKGYNIISQVS